MDLQPNTQGCTRFVSNTFKKEKCRDCGLPWDQHQGIIDEALAAQFRKKASPVAKASPVGVSAKQLKAEKRNALLAKKKAAQQPKDDWFFSGPASSPTLRPTMGQSQSITTFESLDEGNGDSDDEDDFKFFSGDALRARQQSEPALRPPSNLGIFKCVNLLDMDDLVGEEDITQPSTASQATRTITTPLIEPTSDKDLYNMSMSTNDIESPTLLAALPFSSSETAAVRAPTTAATPVNEKVSLLEQRLRDAQAEKEIAVDIVKDELAHEKACNIELTTMVQSQERLIDELRVKLEASKGSSPTANNDDRITELENKLRELENKSKAESEASATSTAHLRDELTIREGEIESLRKAVEMATNENVELRRLAENTEADRCQREESDEGVQALKERIIEAEGIIGNLKERIKGQEEELEQRRIGLQKVEARVTELSLANSKLEEAAAVAAEAHDRDLQRVALEKVAEIELKDEELRSTNEEIQRHEEEMKAIKAQLSHGLKVEKELLNTRAALQELRTIRDQQANELVSREKIIAAHAEEMSRLSKESLDLNKRIEDQDRSESELHVMYQQVKSEYGKQLEETEDLRGRAEEQRMALADAEAKLKESTQSVEDLRASLDGKEAEIADLKQAIGELTTGQAADAAVWFRSHMEREIAVLKARGKKIDLAKNDELDKLRLALEATVMEHASEKAQMQASIVKLEEALTDLQTQYDATTDELHTLRAAAATVKEEEASKMHTLDTILADQRRCYKNILAVLERAIQSSSAYSTLPGPPQQASFTNPRGVSSTYTSEPSSPDPEMAWYTEDEELIPKHRSSSDDHPNHTRLTNASIYNMNDEPERIDTAEADESPSPSEEGMMVSSRVSQVVDRLVSQLREAQQSRLRVESLLEEYENELELRRAEAARPYFAEILRCRWPFSGSTLAASTGNRHTTHASELRNLMNLRDLEVGMVRDRPSGRLSASSSRSEESG